MTTRLFLVVLLNVIIFIAVRYISLVGAFLSGLGASDHYKYESYFYAPGTLAQIGVLVYLVLKRGSNRNVRIDFLIALAVVIFMSVAGFMGIIPYHIIPY